MTSRLFIARPGFLSSSFFAHPSIRAAAVALIVLTAGVCQAAAQAPAAPPPTAAAEAAPEDSVWRSITFGATLEGYYQYNWNRPPDRSVALRAYDTRSNSFSIQQVAVAIDAAPAVSEGRRYGMRLDLQFGQATETLQGGAANEPRPDLYRNIWQAYGSYVFPIGRGLQADFGKFGSNLGFETNYAKDNQAFSRAYLFNFLPFYHAGVRATLPLHDKLTVMYVLANGTQQTEDFNNFKSQQFTAIVKPAAAVSWTVNYYLGQEQADRGVPNGPDGYFRVLDSYVAWSATSALTLGLDANHTTNQLNQGDDTSALDGVGSYARYQFTPALALGARYEHIEDDGLFGGIEQRLQELTLTAERKFTDHFILRAEYRRDWSNQAFFPGRVGSDDARRQQNTALIGGIWTIGNKQGVW